MTGQTVKNTAATSTYMDLSYTYLKGNSYGTDTTHKTGQLTKIVDNLDHNRDKLYEFDALGRIRSAKGGSAAGASWVTANWTQTYSYDRYGNKTGVSASGITQDSNAVPADGLASLSVSTSTNRVTTSGWEYDKLGNLIRGQNASGVWWRFEYDAAGRLKKVKDDSNNLFENYTYGAGREKLLVDDGESYSYYVWGGGSIVAEYTSKGASPKWKKSYIYAGSRLLMAATKVNATTEKHEFHHPDRLGTQLVTNGGTGTSYRQTTLPFGTALGAESTGYSNQVFTSYDRSSSTGLDYAVNRTYSKGQSRFTQVDPIGMASASLGNPQSNNLYAYTQNMPTDFVDPSGLEIVQVGNRTYFCFDNADRWDEATGTLYGGPCIDITNYFRNGDSGPIGIFDPGVRGGDSPPCNQPGSIVPSSLGPVNDGAGGAGAGLKRTGGTVGRTGHYANNWPGNQHVSTYGVTNIGKKLVKGTSAVNLATAAIDVGENWYSEGGVGRSTQRAVGRAVGSWAGSTGGAYVGAGVGFIVAGPPGAVIGGITLSAAGGAAGSHVGNEVVHGIQDRKLPRGRRSCP